ncbi:hypothetical protein UCMB321_2506 [Pseudomonas batumici]|uniref:Uncharacterized protein n=1 Tax=Pseudomonas batumici TaxID=226910 RepID=A0A0C2ECV2_9PSED|nr:hypothetical protein UCMB321_2506 [Pseudomonas batumici]
MGGRESRRDDAAERDADERRAPPMHRDAARDMLDDVREPVLRAGLVRISEQYERRVGRQDAGNTTQVAPQSTRGRLRDERLPAVQYDDRGRPVTHLRGQDTAVQPHRSNGTSADPQRVQFVQYGVHGFPPMKKAPA